MNYEDKQKLLQSVLDEFPGNARIVGGAVRDLILGKDIKDIDIVVPYEDWQERKTDYDYEVVSNDEYAQEDFIVYRVHDFDIDIDVMAIKVSFEDYIDGFDYAICQAWMNSDGSTDGTPAFEKDVVNQTLTKLPKGRPTGNHRERLIAKFPDYRLIEPVDDSPLGVSW